MVLNSNATEDFCGVCQGDNSTCTINNKTMLFSTRYHKYGKLYHFHFHFVLFTF